MIHGHIALEVEMPEFVYVDNSNVFIEGKRVSAVRKGMVMNIWESVENKIFDQNYAIDFGKLHEFAAGSDPKKIKRALLFGSRPPPNDSLWKMAEKAGFEVKVEDRDIRNKEKRIDTGLVAAMVRDAYTKADKATDVITLVAGDGDYIPAVRQLVEDGFKVEVVFWQHASRELKEACSRFIDLDPHLEKLAYSRSV
ncbi:MAG TPA: NYN domain-containing protein [Stellaceae bacterium]|nr:NYN domain-containing protein [Stellaceae bacterium]